MCCSCDSRYVCSLVGTVGMIDHCVYDNVDVEMFMIMLMLRCCVYDYVEMFVVLRCLC